jgi:hypothetical protein
MKLRLKDTPKETIDRAGTRTVTGEKTGGNL